MAVGPFVKLDHHFSVDLYFDGEAERYTAVMPQLPGCVSEANTPAEAHALVLEAASLYLESLADVATQLPVNIPRPHDRLAPQHSTAVELREIVAVMELEPEHYMGSHVAMSNLDSGKIVVFPVLDDDLSQTTLTLLVHYAGIDVVGFMQAIQAAEEESGRSREERQATLLEEADEEGPDGHSHFEP